jgi:DNA polymerase (family 10)
LKKKVSINKLVEVAKETGTLLEINAQPDRLDLNDEMASVAKKAGVKLVIITDNHSTSNFHNMRLGVYVARRAWCTSDDILNTKSWKNIEEYITNKVLV